MSTVNVNLKKSAVLGSKQILLFLGSRELCAFNFYSCASCVVNDSILAPLFFYLIPITRYSRMFNCT